jgi:hypothetical protein
VSRSYPILVRDNILERVRAIPFFDGFNFGTNKSVQIQPEAIPFCGVYLIQELMTPDGDADAGEVRFRTAVRFGFSVIVQNNDAEQAEYSLDDAFMALTALFSDNTLYDNPVAKIQGFVSGSRQHFFGAMNQDNEVPIAELRFELTCDLGTITYPPVVPDDLNVIHIKTQYPGGDTQEDIDRRQQVEAEYDLHSQ